MKNGDMMKDLIKQKVLSRNWSFNEISNLKNTMETLSNELYLEMKLQERFDILRELRIREDYVGFPVTIQSQKFHCYYLQNLLLHY